MLAKVYTGALVGLEAVLVDVEVDLVKRGFPSFKIVGLADKAIEEAKERVRSALLNSSADFPEYKLVVNLAPADLKKEGPGYDLPIALGILAAAGQIPASRDLKTSLVMGELSLEGLLRSTAGVLPLAMLAKERGFKKIFLPAENAKEAVIVDGIKVMPVHSIAELFYHFAGVRRIRPYKDKGVAEKALEHEYDLVDVQGQDYAKRALEIAAAGGHNLALSGPPGAGKTLLARTLPSILPPMAMEEALEVTRIYSITGRLDPARPLINQRPFRAPHHTTSRIGLIGGGAKIQPGEISLAHRGVLFIDEFPELPRHVLESLRQPLEDGVVQISRASGSAIFPARFLLVAAYNPCPCGYLGSQQKPCTCSAYQIRQYKRRVSGPIWDRIDLHVWVPPLPTKEFTKEADASRKTSAQVREKVQAARQRQAKRFAETKLTCNMEMAPKDIKKFCPLPKEARAVLLAAVSQMGLTMRAYHKLIKVARTIADLEGQEEITPSVMAEALQFRRKQGSW